MLSGETDDVKEKVTPDPCDRNSGDFLSFSPQRYNLKTGGRGHIR